MKCYGQIENVVESIKGIVIHWDLRMEMRVCLFPLSHVNKYIQAVFTSVYNFVGKGYTLMSCL